MNPATKSIRANVKKHADALKTLARNIHQTPELGLKEVKACAWQVAMLRKWGFTVRTPFAGLPTAYKAVFGRGKPVFCFMAEYDALPELGHGCGHNLIGPAALGAGKALADLMKKEKLRGTIVVMGTPGEEGAGGKVLMINKGALKGIDAAMMAHPGNKTCSDNGCNGVQHYEVHFKGQAAHAAGDPENGRNALDAVLLMFQGINAWRQHLPEACRVHGIVKDGGAAPNIIPEHGSCVFYVRAPEKGLMESMAKRFRDIIDGAALMTETTASVALLEPEYEPRIGNTSLNEAFVDAASEAGMHPVPPGPPTRASTDFGNVSQLVPGTHVYFKITKRSVPAHSPQIVKAAGTSFAMNQTLRTAEAMAMVGYRYLSDPDFREQVARDFRAQSQV